LARRRLRGREEEGGDLIGRRYAEIVGIGGRGRVKAVLGLISERGDRAFRWRLRCLLAYYYR
jgi:hypothetical protein